MTRFAFVAALIMPVTPVVLAAEESGGPPSPVPVYRPIEVRFEQSGVAANPYTDVSAEAQISGPEGVGWKVPLAWDGGREWLLRFTPDRPGGWHLRIESDDPGLDGDERGFTVVPAPSDDPRRHGGLAVMKDHPHHFVRQDGTPFWFLGDTAWALFTDDEKEKHDRDAATRYLKARAGQGFNAVHAMLLSEAGWGNAGGPPFRDLGSETINSAYWREVDERVRLANDLGLTVGLAIGWGDKGRGEPYAWQKFPSDEARKRYVRYVAARYAAHDVYFLVSGEWHAEFSAHKKETTEAKERERFERLGRVLDEADPHGRMIGIHPMGGGGSVREFHETGWMTFGDYQQNYDDLHARALKSLANPGPVVNSEYGYHLRDQNGDGTPDKDNSTSTDAMRHATWDVLTAGGYVVTGFGGTYFGGHRDPGPFDIDAARHDDWEEQIGHAKEFVTNLEWWKLEPADDRVSCDTPRGEDGEQFGQRVPPATTYWCLAEPGKTYVVYARGLEAGAAVRIRLDGRRYAASLFDPRTGERRETKVAGEGPETAWSPPDERDWLLVLTNRD